MAGIPPLSPDVRRAVSRETPVRIATEWQGHPYRLLVNDWTMRGNNLGYVGVAVTSADLSSSLNAIRLVLVALFGAIALGTIRQILSDLVRNELAAAATKKSADAIPRELVVQYVVGAFMAVMTWWLDGGAKLPPLRIDAVFRQLATEGIMRSYG